MLVFQYKSTISGKTPEIRKPSNRSRRFLLGIQSKVGLMLLRLLLHLTSRVHQDYDLTFRISVRKAPD